MTTVVVAKTGAEGDDNHRVHGQGRLSNNCFLVDCW